MERLHRLGELIDRADERLFAWHWLPSGLFRLLSIIVVFAGLLLGAALLVSTLFGPFVIWQLYGTAAGFLLWLAPVAFLVRYLGTIQ